MTNDLNPNPESFDKLISKVDKALILVSYQRAILGAEQNRIEKSISFQNIFIQNHTNKNDIIDNLKEHLNRIGARFYELAIQSANGVYSSTDREQINIDFQILISELKFEEKICGLHADVSFDKDDNLLTQESSEKEMLKIASELKMRIE
jgi:flagellin-like hook-associated protein FlgL